MKKYLYRIFFCIFAAVFFAAQNPVWAQVTTTAASSINFLDNKSVSITTTKYITIDGNAHKLGDPVTVSFENSTQGRESLSENISDPFLSAVMAVWGSSPTVTSQEKSAVLLSNEASSVKSALVSDSETVTVNEAMHIEFLDNKSVAFLKTKSTIIDGIEYQLDEPWAVSYENSTKGRESLAGNISDPFLPAVMAVWGDTPTVILPTESNLN